MPDLSKIASAEPLYLTDGVSQAVGVTTTIPASNAVGIVHRQAGPLLGQSTTSNPAATAGGSPVPIMTDDLGRLVTTNGHVRELVITGAVDLTNGTQTTILPAGGAGVFHDVVMMVFTSESANATNILVRDTTGGAVKMTVSLSRSGGTLTGTNNIAVIPFHVPMPQTTANTNWTVQSSASSINVHCFFQAIKNV